MLIDRLKTLIRRKKRAKAIGIGFSRSAKFTIPNSLIVNDGTREIAFPNQNGIKVAFIDILLDDCYCLEKIQGPIRNVLDVGANVGLFSIATRIAFPNACIHAYEPNLNLEPYLSKNASFFNFNYTLEAVGRENGIVSLELNNDSVKTRSIADNNGNIPQTSFSEATRKFGGVVDLVKLDCEGAEWEILDDDGSWNAVKYLTMEYHLWPNHTHHEIVNKVKNLGFHICSHLEMYDCGLIFSYR